jgi:hypothetical protein
MAIPTGGDTPSYSTFQERAAERQRDLELERSESGAIKLLENEHILAIEGVTVQIWPRLREFWTSLGYGLELDDEELGVIETAWNENQEELVRDKFKVFAEPGQEPGTTLLYVSHRGEELVPQGDNLVWQARPRDVALERGVVERIQEQLGGVTESTVAAGAGSMPDALPIASDANWEAAPQRAELVSAGGGKVYLTVAEDFSYFANETPGLYLFLGNGEPGQDPLTLPSNHSPLFDMYEPSMEIGVRPLRHLVVDYLQGE